MILLPWIQQQVTIGYITAQLFTLGRLFQDGNYKIIRVSWRETHLDRQEMLNVCTDLYLTSAPKMPSSIKNEK